MLMIKIAVIMIVIISLVIIYSIYKNENNDVNYDKWCNMLKDETKNNIDIIKENEKKIKKLNKQLKNIKNK